MSQSYASLTGVRPSGIFDELFVRSPPEVGPFVPVLSLGGSVDLSSKRDISDIFSRAETVDLVAARGYSTAEADALLSAKRATADSYSVTDLDGFLAAKTSTVELDAAITALEDATTTRLTGKLDKAAAYTSTQVDQLSVGGR